MSNMNDFIIEDGVLKKYIGSEADVVIPDGITTIGSSAFRNCTAQKNIVLPESITKIEHAAFAGCVNLQSIVIPNSIKNITFMMFCGCTNLHTVILPPDLKGIGGSAFSECKNLTNIQIPQAITHIDSMAFFNCEKLQEIEIPKTLEFLGVNAFSGCRNLQRLSMTTEHTKTIYKESFPREMELRSCILPSEPDDEEHAKILLDLFGTRALAFPFLTETLQAGNLLKKKLQSRVTNKKFREQYIPKLITQGETKALEKMLLLVKKMLPEEIDGYIAAAENRAELCAMLMEYKKNLYSVETLEKMEEIQMEKAFGMREKTLADYRKTFTIKKENDVYVITGYKGTEETVYIPSSIKNIPVKCTMKNNQTIKEVFFEEGVTEISESAFYGCKNLKHIFIPESVQTIGKNAFMECPSLADENGLVIVKNILFDYFGTNPEVIIPEGVTRIEPFAFFNSKIESITIPESVTDIGMMAFSNCVNLKSATIPGGVSDIYTDTFYYCRNLESVIISEGVALIADEAFSDCESLQSIIIPESVKSIGNKAFSGCSQLKIFAPKGSFAESYAKKKRIRFQKI